MAFWNRSKSYFVDKPIVAFPNNVEAPYSVTLQAVDFGLNYTDFPDEPSKKSYPGGHFIVREKTNTNSFYYRFLPATKVNTIQLIKYQEGANVTGRVIINATIVYQFTNTRDLDQQFHLVKFINNSTAEVYSYGALTLKEIDYKNRKLILQDNGVDFTAGNNTGIVPFADSSGSYPANPGDAPTTLGLGHHFSLIRSNYLRPIVRRPYIQGADTNIYYQTELMITNILGIHEHSLDFTDIPTVDVAVISRAAGIYANNLPYSDPDLLSAFQTSLNPRVKF